MSQYYREAVAVAGLVLLIVTVPYLFSSISRQNQVKPAVDHSLDSAFIPKLPSKEFQTKAKQLAERIAALKNGSSCLGQGAEVCEHLKTEYKKLLADADIAYQNEVNRCLIYESKWNTTCQAWKAESEKLLQVTIEQSQELKNNLLKIQTMANLISQLHAQIKNIPPCPQCQACIDKPCPVCPKGGQVECPPVEPCPQCENCPICQECQECPHCYDEDYNQLQTQYTNLYRKFEECEGLVKDYHNKPKESSDCSDIQDVVRQKLRNGMTSLGQLLRKASIGSQSLKQAISKAGQTLRTSNSVQESMSVVPAVLNSLTRELHDLAHKAKHAEGKETGCERCGESQGQILNECMNSFKKAVDKLKICEKQLSPFLVAKKQ